MRRSKRRQDEELNYWQPTSDLLSGLMLVLMLVIVLMGLYLIHIPEDTEIDPELGDSYQQGGDLDGIAGFPTATLTPSYVPDWAGGDGGAGGGGAGGWATPYPSDWVFNTTSPTPTLTPSPTPDLPGAGGGYGGGAGGGSGGGEGPGNNPDSGIKSAVYVMMVDGETERTIKKENVEFELYEKGGALQILNIYYPVRQTFRSYLTGESGTFYFPEKIAENTYEIHQIGELEGYDPADNVTFVLNDAYDWPDPFVVRVPIYPSRNFIRVQMTDAVTRQPIAGGSFDVIAQEDIITADGTLRYSAGQVVGEIICDENGYGESEKFYLGSYALRQKDVPQYYAGYQEDIPVTVSKVSNVEPELNTVALERTKIQITVADEFYPTRGIEGAVLNIRPSLGDPFTATTGYDGLIVLDQLEKGVTYSITQTGSAEKYQLDRSRIDLSVAADGRIDGAAETALTISNRLIRAAIGLTDEFSVAQIPGVRFSLFTESGETVETWTTSGTPQMLTGLTPGSYYLLMDADTEHRYPITINDQAEIQQINIHTSYLKHYLVYGGAALLLILVLVAILIAISRRRHRKAAE